jgi:choline monooxygenase
MNIIDSVDLAIVPLERAETIPSAWYVDPAFHTFDQKAVLARSWQLVGHETRLSEAGDYLVANVAGESVLVVRDSERRLRAHFNVCRHRGGPLVMDACGRVGTTLQCKYHGWTYRLDGSLRGVPRFDRTELFDKRDFSLLPVMVDIWQGLVFVSLTSDPPALASILHGITERIAPLRLDSLRYHHTDTYDVACNWKVYVDNYLEGYHVPLVHPELNRRLDFRSYTTETHRWYSLQHSDFKGNGPGLYSGADEQAYYYFIFPNIMLNILPGRLQTNVVEPLGADRCRVRFDYYFDKHAPESIITEDVSFSDEVQQEDIEICEHVQRGLTSRAYDRGRFSVEMERGVYHFQCLLKEAYGLASGYDISAAHTERKDT